MNFLIRRLTFITLVVGALGAIAGIWGMNFEVEYFKYAENGFWLTIAAMISLTLGLTILARWKRWI
jgi:Mg2+ and Co2+ transporter CorA